MKRSSDWLELGREVFDTAVEKGKAYVESDKDIAREAANATDEGAWGNAKTSYERLAIQE